MDCKVASDALVACLLATAGDAERADVEAHLVECASCVREYFALKRNLERAGEADRPSAAARARLRDEVARTFAPKAPSRARRWLRRPIPLYQGALAAAFAVVLAFVAPSLLRARGARALVERGPYVDSSRVTPESVSIY
jgi:hypothetical protein